MASTQIRNRGTVAGNICNAVPSADTAPPLLVLDASVKLVSADSERVVPIKDFFTGVCRTVVQPNELMVAIMIPKKAKNAKDKYCKYTIRKALDLAMVGVGVNLTMEADVCKDVKIALGAVAVTPKYAEKAQEMILGKKMTPDLIKEAARLAGQEDCRPITDIRATADYRREMVRILTRDILLELSGLN